MQTSSARPSTAAAESRISGYVATIAGTLALVVGWIPIVGQALAAVI